MVGNRADLQITYCIGSPIAEIRILSRIRSRLPIFQNYNQMSIFLETAASDSWQLLTPCSSCNTFVHEEAENVGDHVTIILPNLVDRINVSVRDVELFVSNRLVPSPDVTVTHLLIYLFLKNTDTSVTHINNLRLLHTGRQYTVQKIADLMRPLPTLMEVTERFSTFQLFVSLNCPFTPIRYSIDSLLQKTTEEYKEEEEYATTYADTIIRKIRRVRRLSLATVSSRNGPVRTNLNDSTTDFEELDLVHAKPKFRTLRRVFRRRSAVN